MRITFQTTDTNQNVDRRKIAERGSGIRTIGTAAAESGYALDISGTVMDNGIYNGQGKTTEDIMREAGSQDVTLIHNYMSVMSNTMSDEDFARLQKDGYSVSDTDVETAVTIVDQIKAALLRAGVSVTGYTDTLDADTLTAITGDAGLAQEMLQAFSEQDVPLTEETANAAMQALDEAQMLTQPGDDTLKYMAANEMEPTLQDVYMAQYNGSAVGNRQGRGYYQEENGYLSKKADSIHWESLQPQIDDIIEDAGLTETEGSQDAARWLVEAGVPLTKETLTSFMELKKISLPMEQKELLGAMATAVSDGKEPGSANLAGADSLWQQAVRIWQRTQEITDQAADLTADQGKSLTLHNLDAAQQLIDSGYENITDENVTARRQLEEVRLQMTISANRELLKSGYAIETEELEKVVEALKEVESSRSRILYGGEDSGEASMRASLYTETLRTVESIPQLPLAVIGKTAIPEQGSQEESFTLGGIRESGEAMAAAYKKANESYETFQTAPRSDMGDSIQKAFRNTEELLNELGLESTDANNRAVRILGYNSMEITPENIMTVKEADQSLRNVVRKLTPAATLQMIRDGENPLTMKVEALDDYLNDRQQGQEAEQEKYSKFLYKLERKDEITEEEKESYIGIYRLLRQVEKTDGAVIGSLIEQGAELSFKNLLTAVRTSRAKGMDAVINDDFGTLQEAKENGTAIDIQIETAFQGGAGDGGAEYYKRLCREAYDGLDGDKIAAIDPDDSMDLETFTQQLGQVQAEEELEASYLREQINEIRQMPRILEDTELLRELEEPVTLENIQAVCEYRQNGAKAFSRIRKEIAASSLEERFNSREEASSAYREMTEAGQKLLEDIMYGSEGITSLDLKELGLACKQLSFMAKLSDQEKYDVPIVTEESVMALHLQIVHSGENEGLIEASMDAGSLGKLSVKLQVQQGTVKGLFIASEEESGEELGQLKDQLNESLSQMGYQTEDMNIGFRKNLQTGFFLSERTEDAEEPEQAETSTKELYTIAKALIRTIHKQAERS